VQTRNAIDKKLYRLAAEQIESGLSSQIVQSFLIKNGLDQEEAEAVISDFYKCNSEENRTAGRRKMYFGGFFFICGTAITVITYCAAAPGGTYVISWGAIIFGAILFIRGLVQAGEK
jgi:hypothetical protein